MATIHMVLQGKGGVGKSFVAAALAQFIVDRAEGQGSELPLCIDTDPVNRTFSGYGTFAVRAIELMEGTEIDPLRFDALMELLLATGDDRQVVVDNGAATFVPLSDYLLHCDVPAMLVEAGHRLLLHTVVTGGQSQLDTIQGLHSLLSNFDVPVVVWLNPVHGPIEHQGRAFAEFQVYQEHRDRIAAVVEIPTLNPKTSGRDLSTVLKQRRTLCEVIEDQTEPVMRRQRLKMIQRDLFRSVHSAGIV